MDLSDEEGRPWLNLAEVEPSMMYERIAVVTGANKGVGFCIAQHLLPTVSVLIVACRDRERGEAAVAALDSPKARFEQLDISSEASIAAFCEKIDKLDVLVNNAAIAFKGSDPTPFEEQTEPTLATNYHGTVALTEGLWGKLAQSPQGHIVNVASMAGRLSQLAVDKQKLFVEVTSKEELDSYVEEFKTSVKKNKPWSKSNYGLSKLAVIAYTKMKAREAPPNLFVNCCCPGYCATDMSSHKGPRSAYDGAKNAAMLALPTCNSRGEFVQNGQFSDW